MPATHKVSVGWQIVFTFLPIVNFWAFYRIRKLVKYLLYVIVPSIVFSIGWVVYVYNLGLEVTPAGDESEGPITPTIYGYTIPHYATVLRYVIGSGLQGFAIYLVIIWSRKHNQQFDQPLTQAGPSQ